MPVYSKRARTVWAENNRSQTWVISAVQFFDFGADDLPLLSGHGVGDAAWPNQAFAESVAAQRQQQIEEFAPDTAEIGGGRIEGNIAAQGAEITDMIGDPLQFQSNGSDSTGARFDRKPGQSLDRLAAAEVVADGGIAGNGLADDGQPLGCDLVSIRSMPRCW